MADAGFPGTRRRSAWLRVGLSLLAYLVVLAIAHALAAAGVAPGVAYQLLVATVILDARLLWTYFHLPREHAPASEALELVA